MLDNGSASSFIKRDKDRTTTKAGHERKACPEIQPSQGFTVCDFCSWHTLEAQHLRWQVFSPVIKQAHFKHQKFPKMICSYPLYCRSSLRYSEGEETSQTEVLLLLLSTYFHCTFLPSLETDSTLNFSICSLTQQLSSQLVQVCQRNPEERTHPSKWILKMKIISVNNIKTSSLSVKHPSDLCSIKVDLPVLTMLPFSPPSFKFQKNQK